MRAKRVLIIGCTAVTAGLLCAYLFAAESQTASPKTPDLAKRVAELEEKVARLEKAVAQLSSPTAPLAAPQATPSPTYPPAQPTPQFPPGVPPNAKQYEFNGQTYYIMPLGQQQAKAITDDVSK